MNTENLLFDVEEIDLELRNNKKALLLELAALDRELEALSQTKHASEIVYLNDIAAAMYSSLSLLHRLSMQLSDAVTKAYKQEEKTP